MHQLRYYVEKPSSPLLVRITVHSHNIVVVVSCGQQIGARALYLVILTNSSHGRNCARVVYVDVNQISRLQWLRHESLKLARCRRIWAVAERKRAMVAQTYCVTRRGCSQRLVVAHGLWQSKHLLVGRWCLSARKTSVWGLPQLVGIRALVVDLAVVAHVASNVPDAPLVVADHVRRPVVVVQMGLSTLDLAVPQPIDEEEEQGQGECGDHATGH